MFLRCLNYFLILITNFQINQKLKNRDVEMNLGISNKVALVAASSQGLGKAVAMGFAQEGAKVVICARNNEKLEAVKTEIDSQTKSEVLAVQTDLTKMEDIKNLVAESIEKFNSIDILVNNAGITKDGMFKKMSKEKWDAVMNINLDGLFNITKPLVEGMTDRGWGRIINISSINGQKGQMGQTNYAASKAGMHGFTMSLAQEVARKGVTVNTVSPGYIATEMVMAVPEDIRNQIIAGIPVNRLGTSEEVAALVSFLCSNEAGFTTGADFAMNGGQHMM